MVKPKRKLLYYFLSSAFLISSFYLNCNNNSNAESIKIQIKKKYKNPLKNSSNTSEKSHKNNTQDKTSKIKWGTYDESVISQNKDKYVLIDFYTDWCGYCKKLDKETYSNDKVYNLVNKSFIPIKVNAESENKLMYNGESITESTLAHNFDVTAYPYIVFLKGDKVVGHLDGFYKPNEFYKYLTYIESGDFNTKDFEEYSQ